jgi:hypothetical protein
MLQAYNILNETSFICELNPAEFVLIEIPTMSENLPT